MALQKRYYYLSMNSPSINDKVNPHDIAYIIKLLSNIYPIDINVEKALHKHCFSIKLKENNNLCKENQVCPYLYFIRKGALMSYYPEKDKRIVTYVTFENEFIGSISGLYGKSIAKEGIVAIEDSYLIGVNMDVIENLLKTSFSLNYIFRVMFEQYYKDAEERAYLIRVGNARERYLYFKRTRPSMFKRLSVDYIAALLSMNTDTFLRIKKNEEEKEKRIKEGDKILNRLNDLINEKELFKDNNIKIEDLACLVDMPSYKLSSILNQTYQINFNILINRYRVNYIKDILKESKSLHDYTIEGLAQKAGFPSRSTFYKVFKKETGLTPIEYVLKTTSKVKAINSESHF